LGSTRDLGACHKSDVSYSIRIDNNRKRVMEFEKEIDVLVVEDLK
jgi:hypothetical protein